MTSQTQARDITLGGSCLKMLLVVGTLAILGIAIAGGRWLRIRSSQIEVPASAGATREALPTPGADHGEIVFQLHCAKCHGPEGHGDPDAMASQKPPPRDFVSRPWRFDVSLDSIRRVTASGIPATAMPAHRAALSPSDLEAVAAYTYRLATMGPIVESNRSPLDAALLGAGFSPEPGNRVAPALALSDAAGDTRSLADDRGRVVLLHFWGTTCQHCLTGMPQLQQLTDRWQEHGLTVINVSADAESAADAQELLSRVSPETRTWIDETGLANSRFEVQVLPTVWLVDRSGRLLACARGMRDWQSPGMENLISRLLLQPTKEAESTRYH
jgi:thiol-disulfide isomerase/thioredoxin